MGRFLDACIGELDTALRVVAAGAGTPARPAVGGDAGDDAELAPDAARESARLMRVNHSGEIAAQALYRGQAFVARDAALRERLRTAAREERDHLAWCDARLRELGDRASRLAPLWYAGSFAIGALAGLAGDRISLGFLAETEQQVVEHLDGHLARLDPADRRSRSIVEQMRADESGHRDSALQQGGIALPLPVRAAMRATARIMTTLSYRV